MTLGLSRICCVVLVAVFVLTSLPLPVHGQGQAITASELRDAVRKASAERQKNLTQVRAFLTSDNVKTSLERGGIDVNRVERAVSTMSADDLARLSARTSKIQNDFAAGALSNQDLTYVVIALAAAVLVLIVVAA